MRKVKKLVKMSLVTGMAAFVLCACGGENGREKAVDNIENLLEEYQQAEESIAQEKKSEYELLGESVQALVDIAEEDSGELETKEQIENASQVAEELRAELSELVVSVEESNTEQEIEENVAELTITFRNDSIIGATSLSILEPQTKIEKELDSFEVGKKINTTVKIPVEELQLTWYLYNSNGECIQETTTGLEDAKEGVIIYYTDDGTYTEYY